MVATRRGAQTGPADEPAKSEEVGQSLRKKPVRKATATKPLPPTTTTSTTRTRGRAEVSQRADPTTSDSAAGPKSDEAPKPKTSAILRAQGKESTTSITVAGIVARTKKQDGESRGSKALQTSKSQPRETRQRRVQGDETTRTNSRTHSAVTAPPTSTRVRSTRATQPTVQPLSPKKGSQVSRARTRSNAKVDQTRAQPSRVRSTASSATGLSRPKKGKETDENAEIPKKDQRNKLFTESEVHPVTSNPTNRKFVAKPPSQQPASPLSEISSMSSRPTTPSDSPAPAFEQPKDYTEDKKDADQLSEVEEGNTVEAPASETESEDELCGPKTPMRRASRNTAARLEASRTRSPTKPLVSSSRHSPDPSTPSDAAEEVLEEPETQNPALQAAETASQATSEVSSVVHMQSRHAEPTEDQDQDHLEVDIDTAHEVEEMGEMEDQEEPRLEVDMDTAQEVEEMGEMDIRESVTQPGPTQEHGPKEMQTQDLAVNGAHSQHDPNETLIIDDTEMLAPGRPAIPEPEQSFLVADDTESSDSEVEDEVEDEDDQREVDESDDEDEDYYTRLSLSFKTPRPETIQWHNLRQDNTIPVDFDFHLSPRIDRSQLGIMPDLQTSKTAEYGLAEPPSEGLDDQSVNFTEFVSIPANTENTSSFQIEQPPVRLEADVGTLKKDSIDAQDPQSSQSPVSPEQIQRTSLPAIDFTLQRLTEAEITHPISTSASESGIEDFATNEPSGQMGEENTPHYMRPTFAFDARRKSLPASSIYTPLKSHARPNTADGASLPRFVRPFEEPWWTNPKSPTKAATPVASPVRARRSLAPFASPKRNSSISAGKTPAQASGLTPKVCSQRSPMRFAYNKHSNTVAGPPRFRKLSQTPLRRPATLRNATSVRKITFDESKAMRIRSPSTTPGIPGAATPGRFPMTPHPSTPLRGVVAIVEVFTTEGASASASFVTLLHRLGAKTTKIWGDRVTHVIFKDGSPTTLQRVRMHNKKVAEGHVGQEIHCVNCRWVSDCDTAGIRVDESDEAYAVDTKEVPQSNKRKRRSMEPPMLINVDGNIVRDRNGSLGRSSLGRSSFGFTPSKLGSPALTSHTPIAARDFGAETRDDASSPGTPAWIAAPDRLVQATAPLKRMRMLELGKKDGQDRRKSLWHNL